MILQVIGFVSMLAFTGADDSALAARLQPLIAAHKGKVALAVEHLERRELRARSDRPMPTAEPDQVSGDDRAFRQAEEKLDLSCR